MPVLRQSTQVIVRMGSFVDSIDGVTPETGITLGAADQAEALKAAGAATVDISGNTWAAVTGSDGWYNLTLTTTDTNTVGDLTIVVQDASVCLPVKLECIVVEEAVYDQLYAASAPGAATVAQATAIQADTDDIQTRIPASLSTGRMRVDVEAISTDTAAADALETMLDGTGGNVLTISQLRINSSAAGGAIDIDNGSGPGISISTTDNDAVSIATGGASGRGIVIAAHDTGLEITTSEQGFNAVEIVAPQLGNGIFVDGGDGASGILARSNNGHGISAEGTGNGNAGVNITGGLAGASGLRIAGGPTGHGVTILGGSTSGEAVHIEASAGDSAGVIVIGLGTQPGMRITGGATGHGVDILGGATSGDGIHVAAQGAGDGIEAIGAGGGFDINADIQGSLSGNVGGNVVGNVNGNVVGSVGSVASGGITAASIATDAIDADAIAASAVTEIQAGLATAASIVTLQADTDDIQARLPATLSGGRMRSQIEGIDAGAITAASIATGAIDADALATDAVDEIVDQVWDELIAGHLGVGSTGEALSNAAAGGAGLTAQQVRDAMKLAPSVGAPAVDSIDDDLDDIQLRLPATLNGGRMRSHVEAMDAGTITAAVIATDAIDADALATDAVTEITAAVDAAITLAHGVGSYVETAAPTVGAIADAVWDEAIAGHLAVGSTGEALNNAGSGASPAAIADAVWDEILAGHAIVGSTGEALTDAAAGGAGLTQQQVADALKLAPAAGAPAAGSVYDQLNDIESCACGGGPGSDVVEMEPI